MKQIAEIMLGKVAERAARLPVSVSFSDEAVDVLVKLADVRQGARRLRSEITELVEDALTTDLLGGSIAVGDEVVLRVDDTVCDNDRPVLKFYRKEKCGL